MKNYIIKYFMADTEVGAHFSLDANDGIKSLRQIKQEIKEARGDLVAMTQKFGEMSPEAANAAKKVAELSEHLKDANKLTEAFNPDTKFRAFGASIQTVVGGFSALQGVMGLVGSESKEVEKALLKVQSALAISQGIAQLQEGLKTFKNLGAVIQQTTLFQKANNAATTAAAVIQKVFTGAVNETSVSFRVLKGAIVATGIGALILLLGEVSNAMGLFSSETDKAAEKQDELAKAAERVNEQLSIEEGFLNREEKLEIARAKARGATEDEIFEIKQKYRRLDFEATTRAYDELKDKDSKAAQEKLQRLKDINAEGQIAQLDHDRETREKQLKASEEFAKSHILVGGQWYTKEQIQKAEKDAAEDVRIKAQHLTDGRNKIERPLTPEEIAIEANIAARKKDITDNAEYISQKLALDSQATFDAKEQARARAAIHEQEKQNRELILHETANLLGAFSELVGKQTAAGKVLAVAQATIDTYQSATAAYRSMASIPVVGPVLGAIAAAAAIASGIANVKKILAVQIPGKGGGGSAPSIGSSAVAPPITPQRPTNSVTQLDRNSLNAIGNATSRAFVIESDVSNNQERIKRLNRAARL